MKIENEKIIQATEDELYSYWLSRGWDDIYSFPEYMQRMKDAGCEVIAEMPQTIFDRITASPEVLAQYLVFWEGGYTSRFINFTTTNQEQATTATVAKLKEEVEK